MLQYVMLCALQGALQCVLKCVLQCLDCCASRVAGARYFVVCWLFLLRL